MTTSIGGGHGSAQSGSGRGAIGGHGRPGEGVGSALGVGNGNGAGIGAGGLGGEIVAGRGGGGSGNGAGLADLLRTIRQQIERAKVYPEPARREGAHGTVEVRFRIAPDGSVERTEILRSSGSKYLDEASERTIRQAAPYPPIAGWIRILLSYHLHDR